MSVARIKKQAEEADQMIQSLREGEKSAEEETPTEVTSAPEQDQGVVVVEDEPAVDEQPSSSEETGTETDWQNEARVWEQRYRSLNGMIQSRDKQIQQLHELLANMQQTQSTQPVASAPKSVSEPLITQEDEDSYGADLVDMARRAGRQESAQLVEALRAEMAEIRNSLQGVSQVTQLSAKERFETKLDSLTNNRWRSIDSDQAFVDWLKASNARRRVFAQGVQDQDAATVAEFFNDYAQLASANRAAAEQPKQTRKAEIERQVAPGRSKAGTTPSSQAGEDKQWTRSDIAKLYANKRQYNADEFNKLERDVAAAQREGRVDFNR